jgi:hypothetical protein
MHDPRNESTALPSRFPWPPQGEYRIAGTVEPITILSLEPHGEVRILRSDGSISRVSEHRVRLERRHLP